MTTRMLSNVTLGEGATNIWIDGEPVEHGLSQEQLNRLARGCRDAERDSYRRGRRDMLRECAGAAASVVVVVVMVSACGIALAHILLQIGNPA